MTKTSLSVPKQQLVELLQEVNFGRIEGLRVRENEPVLDPPPRVIRSRKLGNLVGPRPERALANFELRQEILDLCDTLNELTNGTACIVVRHGLPFTIDVEAQ